MIKNKHAWYALRRTLPPFSFEENFEELIKFLPQYQVDEIIVKIDSEEFFHGQPTIEWVKKYQENLYRIKDAMSKLNILFSINPWITTGHNDRGRDSQKTHPGLQTSVGHDGTQATCVACSICPVWRENTAKVWTLYAETEPHVIWIEDDIRSYGHRPTQFACFCPLHMKRFSDRIGRNVSREELTQAILTPGKPHPWRGEYLDMQADIMIDTVQFLAKAVHRTSPETSLGLMSSGPRNHCREGRKWQELATALADGKSFYSRPPLGSYHETSLQGLYYTQDSIKITRHCLPEKTIELTEVENVPFTQYSKSTSFTFLQIAASLAYGAHGVTLNLFDHCGSPMEKEPSFGRMLKNKKPFLNALAAKTQLPGKYQGVKILHHEKYAYNCHLATGDTYLKWGSDDDVTYQMLEHHGIPTTYTESNVIATSGQLIRSFDDDQIKNMLSRGILIDAVAAGVLQERGFGSLIGLQQITEPQLLNNLGVFSAEEFFNSKYGGKEKQFLTLTLPTLSRTAKFSIIEPVSDTHTVSVIVDPDANRHHVCLYTFENSIGGRIAVYSYDLVSSYGVAFCSPERRQQLQHIINWLSFDQFPLMVRGNGAYPLCFRKDLEHETILGFFNLTLDPWTEMELMLEDKRSVANMKILSDNGNWFDSNDWSIKNQAGKLLICSQKAVPYNEPLFILIRWQ